MDSELNIKQETLQNIDSYWKFDNYQGPSSSWYDKQDLLAVIEKSFDDYYADIRNKLSTLMNLISIIEVNYNKFDVKVQVIMSNEIKQAKKVISELINNKQL